MLNNTSNVLDSIYHHNLEDDVYDTPQHQDTLHAPEATVLDKIPNVPNPALMHERLFDFLQNVKENYPSASLEQKARMEEGLTRAMRWTAKVFSATGQLASLSAVCATVSRMHMDKTVEHMAQTQIRAEASPQIPKHGMK